MISAGQTVEQLFNAARERCPAERVAFLDSACKNLPEVRQKVEQRLLAEELRERSTVDWSVPSAAARQTSHGSDPIHRGRFEPGQVIAQRFTVIRYIARGGMGEVYEVEDRFLQGVHIALKVILPEIAGDTGSSRRFEQEVLLARKVTHPNLCPIYDIARSDDPQPPFLFLTMKLLTGETLSSRLRQTQPIPREEAIAIFRQMAAGLAAIHDGGIIHRDIKPNNVMLDYSGPELCLSIMDFGLARLHQQDETTATSIVVAGTPGYMAPEILRGESPSQASDFFALGVLLHQVLTGERPRFGATSLSVEPSPALNTADVPPAFLHAVKEFLSIDPQRRIAAFKLLQTSLTSNSLITSWPPTADFAPPRGRLLSRRQFAVGSALATCAAAGGIAWKWEMLNDLLHPLPGNRFVALMAWPAAAGETSPIVSTVLGSIHSRLARAEAYVKNLLIISSSDAPASSGTPVKPSDSVNLWGANLVLAASLHETTSKVTLLLQVLDAETQHLLRSHRISTTRAKLASLADKGSAAAAMLLDLPEHEKPAKDADEIEGISAPAFLLFSQAEQLSGLPNNTGLDGAIEKYGECLNMSPHFRLGYARLAIAYTRKYLIAHDAGILNLAEQNAENAADSDSNFATGLFSRALVYLYKGDTRNAMIYFSKALKADPGNPEILLYRAQALLDLNRGPEAEQLYRQILKERPNYWPANNELGSILFRQSKYQQAADAFDAAANAAPNVALPLTNLATMYAVMKRNSDAIDAAERSIKRIPTARAYLVLGDIAFSNGDYKAALADYQQAAVLAPNAHLVRRNIGDCYAMLGQPAMVRTNYAKAADLLSDLLKQSTRSGYLWMTLAFYHAKIGDRVAAESDMENAEQRGASDNESQFMKVQTLVLLGKKEEATVLLLACMDKKLSPFEVELALDLKDIRKDPRVQSRLSKQKSVNGPAASQHMQAPQVPNSNRG